MSRQPRHRLRAALLALSSGVLGAGNAIADEPASPPQALNYSASATCPARHEFWRQVVGHSRGPPAKPLRPIHVEVLEGDGIALARVTFVDDRGASGARELSGVTCAEAAAAAALVVALEIDAQLGESPAPAQRPAPPDAAPTPKTPVDAPRPPPRDALVDRRQPDGTREAALVWNVGASAVMEHAVAPDALIGASAFFGVGSRAARWDVRANFVYMRSGVVERAGQSAEFVLLGGRLEGCAFPFLNLERSTLGPCLVAELASVSSSGRTSAGFVGSDESTAWLAMGPLLRFRQTFAELHVELLGGPWFPAIGTRTFVFEQPSGEASFHEVPVVGFTAAAGLSLDLN
jgi:hypothetical protein